MTTIASGSNPAGSFSAACRPDCIAAINEYRQMHGLADLVVCCRQEAYETACTELAAGAVRDHDARLQLNGAVLIRPLTTAQIRQHAPPSLAAAIFQDETLLEIAQSPLNLNMMQTVFSGGDGERQETAAFTRSNLFDQYVQRMFQRQEEKGNGAYARAEVSEQLTWLARQMQRHNQSIFLIEQLQPSWLANGRTQWLYLFLTRALMSVILGTPVMWSFIQLIGINPPHIEVHFLTWLAGLFGVTAVPWNTLFALIILNLFSGSVAAMLDGFFFIWRRWRGDGARIDRRLGGLHLLVVGGMTATLTALLISQTDAWAIALFLGGMDLLGIVLVYGYESTEKTNRKGAKGAEVQRLPERKLCVLCAFAVKLTFFQWSLVM